MNRNSTVSFTWFAALAIAAAAAPTRGGQLDLGMPFIYEDGQGNTMPYRLGIPDGYDEPGRKLPMVIYLHGAGARGDDNLAPMNEVTDLLRLTQSEERASFLFVPQAANGGFWDPLFERDFTLDILDELVRDYPIDTNRIYVTGFSMGGFGTTRYLAEHPDRFAAGIPIAGALPFEAERFKDVPIYIRHGNSDIVVDVGVSRDTAKALIDAGGAPIYDEIFRGAHGSNATYSSSSDAMEWMFQQSLPHATRDAVTFVPRGSVWKFLDDGSDQGMAWREPDFDDTAWPAGPAELGHGNGDEATLTNCTPGVDGCTTEPHATTYFRHEFTLDEVPAIDELTLFILRDDSAAVFLNGVEVFRDFDLTRGDGFDFYSRTITGDNYQWALPIDASALVAGRNVLAVEVHQSRPPHLDLSFDLSLSARIVPEPGSASLLLGLVATLLCRTAVARRAAIP